MMQALMELFSFPTQAGGGGPLQKEELQAGVDVANSVAQQYQLSKFPLSMELRIPLSLDLAEFV